MTGPAKRTRLAQYTPYHKMVNILSFVYNVYFLQLVKRSLKFFIDGKIFTSMASVHDWL